MSTISNVALHSAVALFLGDLVSAIAWQPARVSILTWAGARVQVHEIHCDAADAGRLVGASGAVVRALEQVAYAACKQVHPRMVIEVVAWPPKEKIA